MILKQQDPVSAYRKTRFDLTSRVAIITGGAGLLGQRHAEAILEAGGTAVLLDIHNPSLRNAVSRLNVYAPARVFGFNVNITKPRALQRIRQQILKRHGRIDILINNAAIDAKVRSEGPSGGTRLESFSLAQWNKEINTGLSGSFLCAQVFGTAMAAAGRGVILNICSDLSVIAPDQRVYRRAGLPDSQQPVKPVTYSVIKSGLIGLTRYLATYWADHGIRVNALSPGGVQHEQSDVFLTRIRKLIPLGRLAKPDEYKAAVLFLVSDGSSYMTGSNLIIDGGRSVW